MMKDRQERKSKTKGAFQDGPALFPKKAQIRNARQPLDPHDQNLVPDSEGCSHDPAILLAHLLTVSKQTRDHGSGTDTDREETDEPAQRNLLLNERTKSPHLPVKDMCPTHHPTHVQAPRQVRLG